MTLTLLMNMGFAAGIGEAATPAVTAVLQSYAAISRRRGAFLWLITLLWRSGHGG